MGKTSPNGLNDTDVQSVPMKIMRFTSVVECFTVIGAKTSET